MSKFTDVLKTLEKKEKEQGREDVLEKGDFQALMIASFSIFGPTLLAMLAFFGIITFLVNLLFK